MSDSTLGMLLFAFGGLAGAMNLVPSKGVRGWAYETWWLTYITIGLIICPPIICAFTVPHAFDVIAAAPAHVIARSVGFGMMWGVGALSWGLMIRYLGFGLGQTLGCGLCAALGVLLPPLFKGEAATLVATPGALIVLAGVIGSLAGIMVVGLAGKSKEDELPMEQKKKFIADFDFKKGLLMTLLAGVFSAGMNYGLQGADVVEKAAVEGGASDTWRGMPVVMMVLWGGYAVEASWCLFRNWRNRTFGDYLKFSPRNYLCCASIGGIWVMQFVGQKCGEPLLGELKYISFGVVMASRVFFSTFLGIFLGEWKGTRSKTRWLLALGTVLLLASFAAMTLGAKSRAPAQPYSIAPSRSAKLWEKHAAGELDTYLSKVTEEGLISVGGQDGVVFHVGDTAFAASNGLSSAALKEEEWVIKSFGRDVVVNGGGTRGCLYAVYHLLEDFCGIRWWIDGDEDVPPPSRLVLPRLDARGRPHFFYRNIYRAKRGLDFRNAVRNRVNVDGDIVIPAEWGGSEAFGPPYHCHTWRFHVPWEEFGKKHPEFFPLINGRRIGGRKYQLCLTNPDLPAVMAASVEKAIAKGESIAKSRGLAPPRLYDMSMNDTGKGMCECAPCVRSREKYGVSGDQLLFENKVAAILEKKFPHLLFSVFAYYAGEAVPKNGVKAADNLVVKLCNTKQNMAAGIYEPDNRFMHDQVVAWRNHAKNLFVWDYTKTFDRMTEGFPFASEYYLGERFRYFADNGVVGMLVEHESPNKGDFYELKYHIISRFLENPYLDRDAVRKDFMTRYYGAAAGHLEEARRYLDRIRKERKVFFTWTPKPSELTAIVTADYEKMLRHFDAAEDAVRGDAKRLERVRRTRAGTEAAKRLSVVAAKPASAPEAGVSDRPFHETSAVDEPAWNLHSDKIVFTDDKEAVGGRAVFAPYYNDHMRMPFALGVYAPRLRKTVTVREWEKPLGKGYRWYDLGRVEFPDVPVFVFLTRSWTIQAPQMKAELTGKPCTVKAHVKFDEKGVWVDRVVMIPEAE